MKAYPKYKPSNIEWIGDIPEHWGITELKRLCLKVTDGSHFSPETHDKGIPYITVKDIKENYIDFENSKRISEEDYFKLKKNGCQPNRGDVLLTKDGTIGKAVVINEDKDFVILSSLGLITPNQSKVTSDYLRYYLISGVNIDQMFSFIHGSALTRLTIALINQLLIVFPTIKEQQSITRYLDDRTPKIDALIGKKQKLIELLKEERIAIINQAVTKGLNPDVPMKDSDIEWLGEVPKHWKIKRMKYIAEIKSSNVDKKSYDNEIKVFLCNYIDVYNNEFIDNSFSFMEATANENEIAKFAVKKEDVLVTKDSETPDDIANPAYIKEDLINTICGYHLAQIRANQIELIGEYLFRLFQSKKFNSHFEVSANGVTRFGLSIDSFKSVFIPLPPVEEQTQIVKYIETLTQKTYQTISRIEKEIALLQEYRTSLISEVVTGKIDVREAI